MTNGSGEDSNNPESEISNPQSSILNPQSAERAQSANHSVDVPKESPRAILFQFVIFPLGIVAVAVAVFFLFGRLAADEQGVNDYLNELQSGGRRERWQAAYQLSQLINAGEAQKQPGLVHDVMRVYDESKSDDPRIRQYLSMVLGKLGDRRATPLLVEALDDPSLDTRLYAALALGRLRDPAGVDPLIVRLASEERDVRKAATYALGELGDRRAVEPLVRTLSDPVPDVRYNAAIALARFDERRATPVLLEMLDRSRLDQVSGMTAGQKEATILAAIPAVVRLAPDAAKPKLQSLATSDPSLQVQSAAREALR